MNITIKEFVNLLSQKDLAYGHLRGWLEDQDERFCDNALNRQTVARIVHQFMKIELGVPDLPDITPANVLADLYTCHTCVNHIAQVYLRGIMDAQFVERDGIEYKVFNHYEEITSEESKQILKNIKGCITTPPFWA
ncbi:MAG: hypothetical protein IK102_02590 [Treponema sp.]|nr:hypothetical protein [Treponema sp.]